MQIVDGLLIGSAVVLLFVASQLFWIKQVRQLGARLTLSRRWRAFAGAVGLIAYFVLVLYNMFWVGGRISPTRLTWQAALLQAPFWWWIVGSLTGFVLVVFLWVIDRLVRVTRAVRRRWRTLPLEAVIPSPSRRQFLERTAVAVSATPFIAGAYGLLYGRLNLEITNRRIGIKRLPSRRSVLKTPE